ncbi:MAG: M1 family aminopeptidase, partial [Bacteroidia bacterium]|nr:M1 family aminopeptidase [Bacteroidia bacterium]
IGYVAVAMQGGAMEHACNIAYPENCIGGGDECERLWVHELAHSWFGNLTTCASAGDMWLNEGFARYCELLFAEAVEGRAAFTQALRELKHTVFTHTLRQDGPLPVAGVPDDKTYSSSVYDKGALVVHALRNRMGDSLFFAGLKAYFQAYAFGNATSRMLNETLSRATGAELHSFFDDWVFSPGHVHLSARAAGLRPTGQIHLVATQLRRTQCEKTRPVRHLKTEIWAVAEDGRMLERYATFLDDTMRINLPVPFKPVCLAFDPFDRLADARVQTLDSIIAAEERTYLPQGVTIAYQTPTKLSVVVRHYVPPDAPPPPPGQRYAANYRSVSGTWNQARVVFLPDEFDYSLQKSKSIPRPLKVFFRPDFDAQWQEASQAQILDADGKVVIVVPNARKGDYVWTYPEER